MKKQPVNERASSPGVCCTPELGCVEDARLCAEAANDQVLEQSERQIESLPRPILSPHMRRRLEAAAAEQKAVETTRIERQAAFYKCVGVNATAAERDLCDVAYRILPLELDKIRADQVRFQHTAKAALAAGVLMVVAVYLVGKYAASSAGEKDSVPALYMGGRVVDECTVCSEKVAAIYAPRACGHAGLCLTCIDALAECPVCRKRIDGKICVHL